GPGRWAGAGGPPGGGAGGQDPPGGGPGPQNGQAGSGATWGGGGNGARRHLSWASGRRTPSTTSAGRTMTNIAATPGGCHGGASSGRGAHGQVVADASRPPDPVCASTPTASMLGGVWSPVCTAVARPGPGCARRSQNRT